MRAQLAIGVRFGVVGSSSLVRDSIVSSITVRPEIAPFAGLRVDRPLSERVGVAGELTVSRSDLTSRSDTTTTITALTVWAPAVALRASASRWLTAEARLGAVIYRPSARAGTLFSDGAPLTPFIGLGVTAQRSLGKWIAALVLHYDLHRFTTTTLQNRGFVGETVVHRVGAGLSFSRRLGSHATP